MLTITIFRGSEGFEQDGGTSENLIIYAFRVAATGAQCHQDDISSSSASCCGTKTGGVYPRAELIMEKPVRVSKIIKLPVPRDTLHPGETEA